MIRLRPLLLIRLLDLETITEAEAAGQRLASPAESEVQATKCIGNNNLSLDKHKFLAIRDGQLIRYFAYQNWIFACVHGRSLFIRR